MHSTETIQMDSEVVFESKIATFSDHELHTHDALEISVLVENEAIYKLSQNELPGMPGEVFLFRPFESHWTLLRDPKLPVKWIMVLFSPAVVRLVPDGYKLLTPFYTMDDFVPLLPADSLQAIHIQQAARHGLEEAMHHPPGWQAKQYVLLLDILVQLYRWFLESRAGGEAQPSGLEPGIIRAVEYTLKHFDQDIDVELLIRLSGMKRTWFYRKFQEATSLAPQDFINRLRLQHCVYLLRHTRKSITEIAFECGFHSLSYFNKFFKAAQAMTPSEYRQLHKKAAH
ncbi:HTH-type transcriptional activator RhaS [compost metagenome]